jgi:hypothetical protein
LPPIPEPSIASNMNGNQDDQEVVNPPPQNEPVVEDPVLEPVVKNPIIIPQQPLNPLPNNDPVEDNQPLALRHTKQTVTAPGEWWKVRTPAPQILDSEDEEEEVKGAHVVVSGINPDPTSYRQAVNGQNSAK